jgi:DNA-binding transcriptional regulator YiaG
MWVSVKGFEGLYEVNRFGEVRGLKRGSLLKPTKKSNGYLSYKLSKNSKYTHKYAHRIVAEAFLENPDNKPTVNHKDGCKENNWVHNLEWSTYSENHEHAYEKGLKKVRNMAGEKAPNRKLTEQDVEQIRQLLSAGLTQRDIAERFGVSRGTICDIKLGRSWNE